VSEDLLASLAMIRDENYMYIRQYSSATSVSKNDVITVFVLR